MKGLSKKSQAGVNAHMKRHGTTEIESVNRMLETAIGRRAAQKGYADRIKAAEAKAGKGKKTKKTKAKAKPAKRAAKSKSRAKASKKAKPGKVSKSPKRKPAAAAAPKRERKAKDVSGVEFKIGQLWRGKGSDKRTLAVLDVAPATVRVANSITLKETQMKKEVLASRFVLVDKSNGTGQVTGSTREGDNAEPMTA